MPAEDVTIIAQWKINQYTLTFIFNNGNKDEVRTLDYNSPIEYPRNVTKDGYTFDGWDSNITSMPAHNVIITVQWIASMVTIVFDRKILEDTSALEEVDSGLPGLRM